MPTNYNLTGSGVPIPSTTRKGKPPIPYMQMIGTGSSAGPSPYPASAPITGGVSRRVSQKAAAGPSKKINRLVGSGRGASTTRERRSIAPQDVPAGDPYLDQLYDLLAGGGQQAEVDSADLMAQIVAAIDPVFNARQKAIENLMARAEQRTATGRQDVEQMYNALGEDYEQQGVAAAEQAEAGEAEVAQLYGQLASNIEGHYSRIAQEQEEMFSRLGIEAAAPEVMAPQMEQQAGDLAAAEQLGTVNRQRYEDISNIDQSYYRQGAPLARLQGANVSAEMLQGLEDYLFQREQDLLQLQGERSSEIASAFQQLMGSAQSAAASSNQWNTEMALRILQEAQRAREWQAEYGLKQQQGLGSFAMAPPDVQRAFEAIMANPNVVAGRQTDPDALIAGTRVPLTDAYVRQLASQWAQQYNLSEAEYQMLVQLLMESR